MGLSQKSKRVTWAPDANLFQIRLFSKAKPLPKSGMGARGSHVRGEPDGELPPGFEDFKPANLRPVKSSLKPLKKWRCPPKFEVNSEWKVASGEESTQVEAENQRERRVLEAVYPRASAIPPSPHAPADERGSIPDDRNTPLIPLIPIEETEAGNGNGTLPSPSNNANNINTTHSAAEVVAALASVLSNSDQRNLIDCNLLIRILSNPKILQQLITSHGASATQELNLQPPAKDTTALNRGAPVNATPTIRAAGPQQFDASTSMGAPAVKNMNYYKNLVQQHGGRQDVVPQSCAKTRMMTKPCIYFNSQRGCKNGASCTYLHDTTLSSRQRVSCIGEVPSAKRVKFFR